jgi:hypothetical protein
MKRSVDPKAYVPNIMAHIDASRSSVPCGNNHVDPGEYLYNRFGEIRQAVSSLMGYKPTPDPVVTGVRFSPTSLGGGARLKVEVTVQNKGTGQMDTQAPRPGTSYTETQDFASCEYPAVSGKYRVWVSSDRNTSSTPTPFRWGLGSPLLPGQQRVVTGYITAGAQGTASWWGGLNLERVKTLASYVGQTDIAVTSTGSTETRTRIVDNRSVGFFAATGWETGSYSRPYGADYRYLPAAAPFGYDTAVLLPVSFTTCLDAGTYDVYAWYTSGTNRATKALYSIEHEGGTTDVTVDQRTGGETWRLLGTYTYGRGLHTVTLTAEPDSPGVVIADAVKWVRK